MRSKSHIWRVLTALSSPKPEKGFYRGVADCFEAALSVPTRELRRWSAARTAVVQEWLSSEALSELVEYDLVEYYRGVQAALVWIRSPASEERR